MGESNGANGGNGAFTRAFLPGLVLGLVVGLFVGALVPEFLKGGPTIEPSHSGAGPATPRAGERDARPGETPRDDAAAGQPGEVSPEDAPKTDGQEPVDGATEGPVTPPGR